MLDVAVLEFYRVAVDRHNEVGRLDSLDCYSEEERGTEGIEQTDWERLREIDAPSRRDGAFLAMTVLAEEWERLTARADTLCAEYLAKNYVCVVLTPDSLWWAAETKEPLSDP